MKLIKKLVPKTVKFYDLLEELSQNASSASELLLEMLSNFENQSEYSSKIHIIENKCDDLTYKIVSELNDTYITPIDREDIHQLTNSLDDIIDCIDVTGSRIHLYRCKSPVQFGPQLCEILKIQMNLVSEIIKNIEEPVNVMQKIVSIRNYETEGDIIFHQALTELFENENDAKEIIKKKEILELMEKAIDKCQTTAIIIEGILIKNA